MKWNETKDTYYLLICMHHEQAVCGWVKRHGADSRTVDRHCAMSLKYKR